MISSTITDAFPIDLGTANPGTASISSIIGDNTIGTPENDVDFFEIPVASASRLILDIDADEFSSTLDSELRLFDEFGTELAFSDDTAAPGEPPTLDSYIEFDTTSGGLYYVGVSSFFNDDYDPFVEDSGTDGLSTGDYTLEISALAFNDTIPEAFNTGLTSTSPGVFTALRTIGDSNVGLPENDVDLFEFQLDDGDQVILDIDARNEFGSPLDSELRLFDASGTELALSDDDLGPGESDNGELIRDSYIEFVAPASGLYYAGVSSYENEGYDPFVAGSGTNGFTTGDYEIVITVNSEASGARLDEALDFNPVQYLASHGDLITAFGLDPAAATAHYQQNGLLEERSADLFDEVRYIASYGDLITAFGSDYAAATEHFVTNGSAEGRVTTIFDPVSYLNAYADLQAAFGNNLFAATEHWIQFGFDEGRAPGPDSGYNGRLDEILGFDPVQYLASYEDLITAFGLDPTAATAHYQQNGLLEERSADLFDEVRYIASYGDLITAFGSDYAAATEHFVTNGSAEGRVTTIFDPVSYLNAYADLQAAFGNNLFAATEHWIQFGFDEGRVF